MRKSLLILSLAAAFLFLNSQMAMAEVIFSENYDSITSWTCDQPPPPGWESKSWCTQETFNGITKWCGEISPGGRTGSSLKLWRHNDGTKEYCGYLGRYLTSSEFDNHYKELYFRWYIKIPPEWDKDTGTGNTFKWNRIWSSKTYNGEARDTVYFDLKGATFKTASFTLYSVYEGGVWYSQQNIAQLGVNDGNWHYLEVHFKANSAYGISDGGWDFWIDGTAIAMGGGGNPPWLTSRINVNFNWADDDYIQFLLSPAIGNVGTEPTDPWLFDPDAWYAIEFDDYVVSTSYIGPTGTPPPPYCGDLSCNGAETCSTCPGDCGACPPLGETILFQESFEDSNFASRGWYDTTGGALSSTEHIDGSRSLECTFLQGGMGCDGGSPARHLFTESDSVYLSYYVKYSDNYVGSGKPYHPHEFNFLTNNDSAYIGPAGTHLTTYIEQNSGRPLLALQDMLNVDTNCILQNDGSFVGCNGSFANYNFTENRSVASCNGIVGGLDKSDCFYWGGGYWYSSRAWYANNIYFQDSPGSYYKNNWHHIEVFFKLNTIQNEKGILDGQLKYWYDGQLLIDYNNILFRTGQHPDMRFNQFMIAPYIGDGSPVQQTMWIDNLTVATSRSGTSYNRADTNSDGCISNPELTAFIDRWKVSNVDVTLKELIEAIGLWKRGCT